MNKPYIDSFKDYLLHHLDRSNSTVKNYINALTEFEFWLFHNCGISDLKIASAKELKNYREQLIAKYSPSSVNLKLCALKAFYNFLHQARHITFDPCENIKIQKVSNNIKSQYLTRAEELRIMERAKKMGKKIYCIIMVLLKCGLRPSEVSKLRINDVHLQGDPTLIIKNSKRNKSRYVPIPNDTALAIKDWMEERNASKKPCHMRSEYLFTSQRAHCLGERAIQRIVENISKAENIKLYCTRFRASFANDLLQEAKIPISILSNLLGHESITTTGRYLTPSQQDIRKYINKISEF